MGYKNKCLLNVYFSHGALQSLLVCKVLVWGTTLLLVSHAPVHARIVQTTEAVRQNSRSAFNQHLGGGHNARNFSTCPQMGTPFITEIIPSFWGVRLVDVPGIKRRRVQILGNSPYIIRALPQGAASLTNKLLKLLKVSLKKSCLQRSYFHAWVQYWTLGTFNRRLF